MENSKIKKKKCESKIAFCIFQFGNFNLKESLRNFAKSIFAQNIFSLVLQIQRMKKKIKKWQRKDSNLRLRIMSPTS